MSNIKFIHGRGHPRYKIVFDRKYLKLFSRRSYRRENIYEMCRNIHQTLNLIFLSIEKDMLKDRKFKLTTRLVKKRLKNRIKEKLRREVKKHDNRTRNVSKFVNSIYKRNVQCYRSPEKTLTFKKFDVEIIDTEIWFEKDINMNDLNTNSLGISVEANT